MARLSAQAKNTILRVAHLGVKAHQGSFAADTLDDAIISMGQAIGVSDDPVVEAALARQGLTADAEAESWSESHSHWDEHEDFSVDDWRYEVENDDTRLGYAEWVDHQIEMRADDDAEPSP